MSIEDYTSARRLALREYRTRLSRGEYPYLPVLDDILKSANTIGEIDLGYFEIPLEFVVGTKTAGRTNSFAANFLPLLDEGSEFAGKWAELSNAHLEEGIREPIKVYEFLNRYYVQEGNKRVSVLKFYNAAGIDAHVYRILPAHTDNRTVQRYYELLDFEKVSGVIDFECTKLGSYQLLLELMGKKPDEEWTEDDRIWFSGAFHFFEKVYRERSKRNDMTAGDAFLTCVRIFGYEAMKNATPAQYQEALDKVRNELMTQALEQPVAISLDPVEDPKGPSLTKRFMNVLRPASKLRVAFVYDTDPEVSGWVNLQEKGRRHVENVFQDQIETEMFVCRFDDDAPNRLREIAEFGYDVIFVASMPLLQYCAQIAIDFPKTKVLCCSLNEAYRSVRTYFTRVYEPKFLSGVAAGILSPDGRIGYLGTDPLYGYPAAINAFALGAKMVNPRAEIYLRWTSVERGDPIEDFRNLGISIVSGVDTIVPGEGGNYFGLYELKSGGREILMSPIFHWGVMYERLIRDILDENWAGEKPEEAQPDHAINYWWGMSSGAVDVTVSTRIPYQTRQMIAMLKKGIITGSVVPFSGLITDQLGNVHDCGDGLSPEELINIDWLADNVLGVIPKEEDLKPERLYVYRAAGIGSSRLV